MVDNRTANTAASEHKDCISADVRLGWGRSIKPYHQQSNKCPVNHCLF